MSGESGGQNILSPGGGAGGGAGLIAGHGVAANNNSGSATPNNNLVSNSAGSPGIDQIASQLNSSNSNQAAPLPQNIGQVAGGGQAQMGQLGQVPSGLNFQQVGLGQPQILGQQRPTMSRQQQQQLLAASNSAALQNQQNFGGNSNQALGGGLASMHRSPLPRIGQLGQFSGSPTNRPSMFYGTSQMTLNHHHLQQQQQLARAGMLAQGQGISMFSGQAGQLNNLSPQYFSAHIRQKQGQLQNSQFQQPVSSVSPLHNFQTLGMMGSLGPQNRMNSALAYAQQTRVGQSTLRSPSSGQPASPQASLSSPQKLQSQNLQRVPSFGSQLSGLSQAGQSLVVPSTIPNSSQWSKIQQSNLPSMASTYQLQQQRHPQTQMAQAPSSPSQQQTTLPQQLSPQQNPQQLQQEQIQQSLQGQLMPYTNPTVQTSSTPTGSQTVTSTVAAVPDDVNASVAETTVPILGKRRIQDLVSQVDPHATIDPNLEDCLLELADNYIHSVTMFACTIAKHRKSTGLEAKDVLLHLEKNWKLSIPGFSEKDSKRPKKLIQNSVSASHVESSTTSNMESEVANTNNVSCPPPWSSGSGVLLSRATQNPPIVSPFIGGTSSMQRLRRF
eukprot:TRINITY_DN24654_c0_g1_i2.p1 TRINITY_DN24654_c0_g1~~TRINITY_DN24654_c0_g1_i2.p1  ORF type:complete len:611 (+),score=139.99 TRINITY_DN24654_c0_g1_i2:141-1973(+)